MKAQNIQNNNIIATTTQIGKKRATYEAISQRDSLRHVCIMKRYTIAAYPSPNFLLTIYPSGTTTGIIWTSLARLTFLNQDDEVPNPRLPVSHLQTSSISSGTV
jgi:hypothetical protein